MVRVGRDMYRRRAALLVAILACGTIGRAECVVFPLKEQLRHDLVFSGKVVDANWSGEHDGIRTTFEVERVWKGDVPRRIDVYTWARYSEDPIFQKGREYVVGANKITDANRRRNVGLTDDDTVAFGPASCVSDAFTVADFVREFGPGRPPR